MFNGGVAREASQLAGIHLKADVEDTAAPVMGYGQRLRSRPDNLTCSISGGALCSKLSWTAHPAAD